MADRKTQDAVLRNLHTLTESSQRLSATLKTRYPDVDWRGMAEFRNVVVHGYLYIKLEKIWSIIEDTLPSLKMQVDAMLQDSQ